MCIGGLGKGQVKSSCFDDFVSKPCKVREKQGHRSDPGAEAEMGRSGRRHGRRALMLV